MALAKGAIDLDNQTHAEHPSPFTNSTSKPALRNPLRVSSAVETKLYSAVAAHGVGYTTVAIVNSASVHTVVPQTDLNTANNGVTVIVTTK